MDELNRVHLNGLRALEVVGRLGTLAKAADELGVSIGAVSQQIIKTEKQLGQAVFQRTPSGLMPTPFGAELLTHLHAGFRDIARGVALTTGPARKTLRVTTMAIFASKWLLPRLGGFQEKYPEIDIFIESSLDLVDLGRSGIDVAIRFGRGDWAGARADLLLEQRAFPVCSPSVARKLKTPSDLCSVPIVRYESSLEHWDNWLVLHGLSSTQLQPGPLFSESSMALDAAIAGLGATLSWQISAHDALRDGRLVKPFPEEAVTGFGLWFVTAKDRGDDRKIGAFRKWLKQELKSTFAM